jgi:hypothetical protein
LAIENWSLAIEFRLPSRSMAIYKFSTAFKMALAERRLDHV